MTDKAPLDYIANISKASAYFAYKNGPVKDLIKEGKLSNEDADKIQQYMQNHLSYLYTVLLQENNIKKFDLIISTMNKFYVNDEQKVLLDDDGFDNFYKSLFPETSNISIKK